MAKITQAAAAAIVACSLLGFLALPMLGLTTVRVPISVLALDACFTFAALASPRLLVRVLGSRRERPRATNGKRALIVGAGAAGEMILKELVANPQLGLTPVGFVDDDPAKHNNRLNNRPVFGPLSAIREIVGRHNIGEIVI